MNWQPIETAPHNAYVLIAKESGYVGTPWDYRVGMFTAGWHDRWDDVAGDIIEPEPLFWAPLPEPPAR